MYNALITLYQSEYFLQSDAEEQAHWHTEVSIDTLASFLMKITELWNQLTTIEVKVEIEDLVPMSLNVFSSS